MVTLTIDEVRVNVPKGTTILAAAQQAEIYIPRICFLAELPPVEVLKPGQVIYQGRARRENKSPELQYEGCQLCVVEIAGRKNFHRACCTLVSAEMVVRTNTAEVEEFRRQQLMFLLAKHPHACLTCAQKEGCARFPCSMNIPEQERCCSLFGRCELQKVAEYVGIKPETPRYVFADLPVVSDEPLFERDYNLCIGCTRCVRVCREMYGAEALDFVFDAENRVTIGTVGPTLRESGCRFCTACVAVCPTGALMDKEEFEQAPRQSYCPAGMDAPRYVRLISEGKFAEAAAVIREAAPFPLVLGYVCPHPCEPRCRRGEVNEPIAIRALKRFAAEHDDKRWQERLKPVAPTGSKVAIVGSGPSGLTAAYYLTRLGHSVTAFEELAKPGGMMRVGIPDYRLPKEVLDSEINEIQEAGVEIRTNARIESTDSLLEQGYNAVFLALGAHRGIKLGVEGEDLPGVIEGVTFLKEVSSGKKVSVGDRVAVIGGGDVAIDGARTALRLGAKEVTIVYRRTKAEMPASDEEIEQAIQEGVKIVFLAMPEKISRVNGKLDLSCIRMRLGEPDASGRRRPIPIAGSVFSMNADSIITAIGQVPDIPSQLNLKVDSGNTFQVNSGTLATNQDGVFAGGDMVTGPASIIEAIASGRKAASSIDRYLGGQGLLEERLSEEEEIIHYLGREEAFADRARVEPVLLPVTERRSSFAEVESTLGPEQAVAEASRCLKCDLRFAICPPILPPKKRLWLDFTPENIAAVPEVEGVYQLLDEQENIIYIKGAMNLHQELKDQLEVSGKARYFKYEEEPMYSQRESELLQQYSTEHGQMPEGNQELDDLF